MSGLGAWSFGRYKYGMAVNDPRQVAALHAFKAELGYIGHGSGVVVDLPQYGNAIRDRITELQHSWGILGRWGVHEGEIDSTTARYLFWTRCNREALRRGIPDRLVHKLITLEALHDPAAQGYADPGDEGGAQIHMAFYPGVTLAQAWDPAFYVPWLAEKILDDAVYTENGGVPDFDGGVAAHNVGRDTARIWVASGKPESGRVRDGIDWFTRATTYVALVRGQRVF